MHKPLITEDIYQGEEAFRELQNLINERDPPKLFFLVDENTHNECLPVLMRSLRELPDVEVLEVAAGEESKSPEVLVQLWYALSELGADRHCMLVNLGGGMVTDLGGFLAGTYLRGITFVNVPTSLLAMVDASGGGKNGINLDGLKNRIGLFLEPAMVCIIPEFLETLPQREMRSGFAEMLKHGLIADADYWKECRDFPIAEKAPGLEMIMKSVGIKSQIVKEDFREKDLRKVLNFGHSIGHAIETASLQTDEALLHGEAIALGMMAELWLSVEYTGLDENDCKQAMSGLYGIYGKLPFDFDADELIGFIHKDKKNRDGELRLSLLKKIGEAVPNISVSEADIRKALEQVENF